jgi:phosphatidylglycerol:prolipoprotein diacylglycerol transferase
MLSFYQHLPLSLDPVLFQAGVFAIRWYAVLGLAGLFVSFLALRRLTGLEGALGTRAFEDLLLALFLGALLGAHLGYIFLYAGDRYLAAPELLLPFTEGHFGLAGLSFHGGLAGAAVALFLFARRKKVSVLFLSDQAVLAAPLISFFGRIGNFLNQELYGRPTGSFVGVWFPGEPGRRHPSALYEAALEGALLFFLLLFFRKRVRFEGALTALYLAFYALLRFGVEFVRAPDPGVGPFIVFGAPLSLGQLLSLLLLLFSGLLFLFVRSEKRAILKGTFS